MRRNYEYSSLRRSPPTTAIRPDSQGRTGRRPCAGSRYHERVTQPAGQSSSIGELEGAVLNALWDAGELSTPAVFEEVGKPRELAYTTILTVLQRLNRKGLLSRRESGKSHIYSPAVSRKEFAERRGQSLAGVIVKLGSAGVVAFLAEATRLDPAVVDLMRDELDHRQ